MPSVTRFGLTALTCRKGGQPRHRTLLCCSYGLPTRRKPGTVSDKGEQGQEIDYITKNCDGKL